MLAVQKLQRQPFLVFFRTLTWTGTAYGWFTVAVVLNVFQRRGITLMTKQPDFLQAMVPSLGTYLFGNLLKRLIGRKRPPDTIPGYLPYGRNPSCGSFPSGHAAAAFAFFVALLVLGHPLAWLVFTWAVLICFSRFYLGVHYPSDIAGGIVLGVACGLAVNLFKRMLTF